MHATTRDSLPIINDDMVAGADALEKELARFEAEERKRLGLDQAEKKKEQWVDPIAAAFTKKQRATTTKFSLLVSPSASQRRNRPRRAQPRWPPTRRASEQRRDGGGLRGTSIEYEFTWLADRSIHP